jgi:pseudouridine-5'-phosphate glycosidase
VKFAPVIAEEVGAALAEHRAVVALESTIIAHGMPYPQNVETAREVESIIRSAGATPATIAVIEGIPRIGLGEGELERFGRDGAAISKVSVRDLPYAAARRMDGATTVAATARLASMAGILVFATGGIGGVHRGAATSFDISADLSELSSSSVAVVTAGAKAILDLPLTLEILETMGVPVVGFGTDRFPAFYSRDSGLPVPMRCNTPDEIADLMQAKWSMGLAGGIVVANPIPAASEIPATEIEPVIAECVTKVAKRGITGKDVTPFLLAEITSVTGGRSLVANIALVRNNARLAADIAVAYAGRTR